MHYFDVYFRMVTGIIVCNTFLKHSVLKQYTFVNIANLGVDFNFIKDDLSLIFINV